MAFCKATSCVAAIVCGLLATRGLAAQSLVITPRFVQDFEVKADSLDVFVIRQTGVGTTDGSNVRFSFQGIQGSFCSGCGDERPPDFVVVSPSSGITPTIVTVALNPNVVPYLRSGVYFFSVAFAKEGESCPACAGVTMTLRLTGGPAPSLSSVVNAATLQPGALSPGELVSVFGVNLGTPPLSSRFDTRGLYPKTLGNSTVTFNGIPAPLLYVSTTQINAVVPYGVAGQTTVDIVVTHNGARSAAFSVPVADTAPGIFTATGTGTGQGAILNYGVSPNSISNPVAKGFAISMFGTGSGLWTDTVEDGSIFLLATRPPAVPVSVTIGGQPARVLYAGGAPFQPPGVFQVNAVVPATAGSGPQPVVLTIGQTSNAQQQVTVAIQ